MSLDRINSLRMTLIQLCQIVPERVSTASKQLKSRRSIPQNRKAAHVRLASLCFIGAPATPATSLLLSPATLAGSMEPPNTGEHDLRPERCGRLIFTVDRAAHPRPSCAGVEQYAPAFGDLRQRGHSFRFHRTPILTGVCP